MIVVDDNLVLRIIHMYEKELIIFIAKILLLLKNAILGRVSSMPELRLTKATRGSRLVGYIPEYHPYVLTSNSMLRC